MSPAWSELTAEQQAFADGRYFHDDGRARFITTAPRPPVNALSDEYPLALNTGRVRDHWHTMTRTGLAPTLAAHIAEPFVDLHAHDALTCGVADGLLARVSTRWGNLVARVRISGEMPRGTLFVPIHWSAQYASDARVGALVNPVVDPVSGEPEFKHTPARVEPFIVTWHGFALARSARPMETSTWWTRITGAQFVRGAHLEVRILDHQASRRRQRDCHVDALQPFGKQRIVTVDASPALPVVAVGHVELHARVTLRRVET